MTFLTILGVTEILCSFKLVLEEKQGKEIPESSRLKFLEKFSANNFVLSDAGDNTSRLLNRGSIRTLSQQLLACLNFTLESEDSSFWHKHLSNNHKDHPNQHKNPFMDLMERIHNP